MKSVFFFIFLLIAFSFCTFSQTQIEHPKGNFVSVNGVKLWYESEGTGDPLILIAGGPGDSHSYFHPYFSSLADSFRVIYFDSFGRGKSDTAINKREYTFEKDVEDLEGLRKALGLGKISLLGHSYGGMVAQAYALKYSSNINKLILANTFFSGEMWQANDDNCNYEIKNQYPEIWEQIVLLRNSGVHSSDPKHQELYSKPPAYLFYFYNPENYLKRPKTVPSGKSFNADVYYTIAGDDCDFFIGGDIAKLDFRKSLKDINIPTLIFAGRYDRVALPRFEIQYKNYMPQAEFVMFEKSGHQPFAEETQKTMSIIKSFLKK